MNTKQRENECWETIKEMDWAGNDFNYKKVSNWLYLKKSTYWINTVCSFCHLSVDKLKQNFISCHNNPFSDDALDDICWHIVGLGKKQYDYAIKNPNHILKYHNRYNGNKPYNDEFTYKESFAYCFHIPDDIKNTPATNIQPEIKHCWACNAPLNPPTQEEMIAAFSKLYSLECKDVLIKELIEILQDLPEEILEIYYANRFIKNPNK